MKFNSRTIIIIILALLVLQCMCGKKSESFEASYANVDYDSEKDVGVQNLGCALNGTRGTSSALLPREIASGEDFGQFSPDDLLKGQNFLDPRQLVGMPETAGGSLRNANRQIRSEPSIPVKAVSIFNNSTITPDEQRPLLEIGAA